MTKKSRQASASPWPEFVSSDKAAEIADKNIQTIWLWLQRGKLTRYKRGRDTFIHIDELKPQPEGK